MKYALRLACHRKESIEMSVNSTPKRNVPWPGTAEPIGDTSKARYKAVTSEKAEGATYTPEPLADFVASKIVEEYAGQLTGTTPLRILDPAFGDGELFISILKALEGRCSRPIELHGFEPNIDAQETAVTRIQERNPQVRTEFAARNFLEFVLDKFGQGWGTLFDSANSGKSYDLIIANPPYVRTQIMGAEQAQLLARQFGLGGRVDLYHAFLLGMASVLDTDGVAGMIVSNRFMTTRSGASVRSALLRDFSIQHIWDLGDTKLFNAAVLPAVLLARKSRQSKETPVFTSIYESDQPATARANNVIGALSQSGVTAIEDGRCFLVKHGLLETGGTQDGVWRVAMQESDRWLATVQAHSWGTFRTIGKARVGVKTTADNVYIRSDWNSLPEEQQPETLRPLITHHVAGRFREATLKQPRKILYTHETIQGKRRPIDLKTNPRASAYLEQHRIQLTSRTYVLEAGREWFEIWVPQDPAAWALPKLVFRDISEKPTFWIDLDGSIVNGDCYWIAATTPETERLLWLACAVANSTFIENFYDHRFNNKLYGGRRRFMTQYVEEFPLPNPSSALANQIIETAKIIHSNPTVPHSDELERLSDGLVWKAFGLGREEIGR